MIVKGNEITEAQVKAMMGAINARFRASDLEKAAVKAGVPAGGVAIRAADRILIQQRKKGTIEPIAEDKPYWTTL